MDELLNISTAKNMARFIALSFLVVHMALIVLFWRCGVMPMAYFNVGSIIFYMLSFAIINKGYLALWTDLMYLEVVAHMTCAAIFCGWNNDFQVAIVGMSSIVFFSEYVGRYLGIKFAHGLPLCIVGALAYLFACAVCQLNPAPYSLPPTLSLFLKLIWGCVVFFVSTMVLQVFVNQATMSEKALTKRMTHDKLTGLPNRYYMTEYLDNIFKDGNPERYWLAIGDIDDFKMVNDTYGHNCGDLVLVSIASILDNNLGGTLVCRWGGEEFLFVGQTNDDMESQRRQLDRVRGVVEEQPVWYEEQLIHVTITLGIAPYQKGYSAKEWIGAADEKLYEGKSHGKNQVVM